MRRPCGEISADDCERGRNVSAAVGGSAVYRVTFERSQLRTLVQRLEVAYEAAPDHVALESDVVASCEDGGAAFAFRHFTAAEDPDFNDRPLGQLTEKFAGKIVDTVVEGDDRCPA